jgi:hypothetical protein
MYRPGIGEVELPNEVERALEKERLVFFCGAGVSAYTGLPLFKGLVEAVFRNTYRPIDELSGDPLEPAKAAFCASQYDRALGLLEQALTAGSMRRAVTAELSKQYDGDLFLHKALLDLARVPKGGYHLVTTNFDARFKDAGLEEHWVHDAPRLAPPRPLDWHHATYLHGRIKADDPDRRQLILTSADFGRAYLQDAWAARFVVELFREFTVLFIGYSVTDPVMSYLVDALAAHRRHSQQFRTAFALAGFDDEKPGDRDVRVRDWQAKSIDPITFPMAGPHDYTAMNHALVAWAEDHRLGLQSRINTALRATNQPYLQRNKETEQVIWALSRHDGSVAGAFATAESPADPSWLKAFEEIEVPQEDGQRFRLLSFPSRPAGDGSPLVGVPLAGAGARPYVSSKLSTVTHRIGVWISRHLDSKVVVEWASKQHGMLHPEFAGVIAWRMGQPDCRISEINRRFWSIVLMLSDRHDRSLFDIWRLSEFYPADRALRWHVIVQSLRPMLVLGPSYGSWFEEHDSIPKRLMDCARIEITLSDPDGIIVGEETLAEDDLVGLSDELTTLLSEALRLARLADLAGASGHSDWEIRSIALHLAPSEHPDRWTILVTLARKAFLALHKHNRPAARALVQRWIGLARQPGFGLFLRLALFAAVQAEDLPSEDLVGILLANDAVAFWSAECEVELAAFLCRQGPVLEANGLLEEMLAIIRKGPPETPSDE